MPGIAYILVKDRSKIKCGLSASWSVSTLRSGLQRKSWKHSSTSSRAPTSAQRSIPFFTSPFGVSKPVGLLGLHSTTRSMSGVTASQYACVTVKSLPSGNRTISLPTSRAASSYSANVGAGSRIFFGASVSIRRYSTSAAPLPQKTCCGVTALRAAIARRRARQNGSG